jgi:hypothetical protein
MQAGTVFRKLFVPGIVATNTRGSQSEYWVTMRSLHVCSPMYVPKTALRMTTCVCSPMYVPKTALRMTTCVCSPMYVPIYETYE